MTQPPLHCPDINALRAALVAMQIALSGAILFSKLFGRVPEWLRRSIDHIFDGVTSIEDLFLEAYPDDRVSQGIRAHRAAMAEDACVQIADDCDPNALEDSACAPDLAPGVTPEARNVSGGPSPNAAKLADCQSAPARASHSQVSFAARRAHAPCADVCARLRPMPRARPPPPIFKTKISAAEASASAAACAGNGAGPDASSPSTGPARHPAK